MAIAYSRIFDPCIFASIVFPTYSFSVAPASGQVAPSATRR